MTWPLLTPSQALAAYAAGHPLHELARMLAHLAEHPAVRDVWLPDPPPDLDREVWVSVQLRTRPAHAGADLARFACEVARRFGWPGEPEYWALIWQPGTGR